MTIESLNAEIAAATNEFIRLSGRFWYRSLNLESQKLSIKQAERIARLYRFRSMIVAKEYAKQL